MKYLKSILCVLLISVLLSGCNFRVSSSIDDLISPLSPFGNNADIKIALDSFAQNGYSLKAPNSGKYITSYSFFDLDGDNREEAVAFYEPNDNLGEIDMAVIKKFGDEWKVVDNIKGDGKEVHSLDFSDLNGNGNYEIIVCWDVISNSTNHQLSVYRAAKAENSVKLNQIDSSISVNNYIAVDMYDDKTAELLLFKLNSASSSSAKAELYSLKNNKFTLVGETKLDSHITTYSSLEYENADNKPRIYADAISSDGDSMLTEIIYWSDNYDTIVSPVYSYSTGQTNGTRRSAMLSSLDINDDKLIEIPTEYSIKKLPSQIKAVDFKNFKHSVLIHNSYALYVNDDKYLVKIPDEYIDKIIVKYNESNRSMSVVNKKTKNEIFSVMPVLKATYSKEKYNDYTVVLEDAGYAYLAKQGNDEIKITADDLKKSVKAIN